MRDEILGLQDLPETAGATGADEFIQTHQTSNISILSDCSTGTLTSY